MPVSEYSGKCELIHSGDMPGPSSSELAIYIGYLRGGWPGQMGVDEIRRLKQLEEENRKLKQLMADLSLDKLMLQDVLSKQL